MLQPKPRYKRRCVSVRGTERVTERVTVERERITKFDFKTRVLSRQLNVKCVKNYTLSRSVVVIIV